MTFKEAFEAMKHGAKVKLPSWAGYWFWCIPAQSILIHTKDGTNIYRTVARFNRLVSSVNEIEKF